MHVLLTGGSGFVGGALARHLVERGDSVTALVRPTSRTDGLRALGAKLAPGDLETGEGLDKALEGVELVHHLAGVTKAKDEAGYQRGNAHGTQTFGAGCFPPHLSAADGRVLFAGRRRPVSIQPASLGDRPGGARLLLRTEQAGSRRCRPG